MKIKDFLPISLSIAILIIASSTAYYFVWALPKTQMKSIRNSVQPEVTVTPTITPIMDSTPTLSQSRVDNTYQPLKDCIDKVEAERINVMNQLIQDYQTNEELKKYPFGQVADSIENKYKEKKQECYMIYK